MNTAELGPRIVESGHFDEETEPDMSTERLIEIVRDDTGADVDRQIESPQRFGILQLEQR